MLRIIGFFIFLIISHASFADVTVPAKSDVSISPAPFAVISYFTHVALTAPSADESCSISAAAELAYMNSHSDVGRSSALGGVSAVSGYCHVTFINYYFDGKTTTSTSGTSQYRYAVTSSRVCSAGSVLQGTDCLTTKYSCNTDGFNLSDASGGSSGEMKYCTLRTSCESSITSNTGRYSLTTGYSGCVNGCSASFVTSPTAQATLDAGGQVPLSEVRRKTIINGVVSYSGGAISYTGKSCSGSEYATNLSVPSVSSQEDSSSATLDMTDGPSCEFGTSTGSFNGQNVIFCKSDPDVKNTTPTNTASSSTGTASGASGTASGASGTATGSGSGSGSGASGTASGASGTDSPSDEEEESGDGGGSFTAPGKGRDYLADLFGADDLAALAAQKTALTDKINQKRSDIKSLFNITNISMSGSISENRQEIKGASVDLSGKNLFDKFSIVAAAFYLCAVVSAIYIVMGGNKS